MAVRLGVLVRSGAGDALMRHRVGALRDVCDLTIIALRTPPRPPRPAPPPLTFPQKVSGKLKGLYARLNYPPRYYDLYGPVREAEARLLPEGPPLDGYGDYRLADVPAVNSVETAALVRDARVDALLPAAAGIVKPVLLEAAPLGCLNTHYGWLPEIRGLWSTVYAIVEDRPDWLGVTVHRMDAGIDTGPIYRRARPRFATTDTHETLWVRMDLLAAEMLREVVGALDREPEPAIANPAGEGVYRSKLSFAQHVRFHRRERQFFTRYGDPACPPLQPPGAPPAGAAAAR